MDIGVEVSVSLSQVSFHQEFILLCISTTQNKIIIRRDEPIESFKPYRLAFCLDADIGFLVLNFKQKTISPILFALRLSPLQLRNNPQTPALW